jgi:hypothetical protein
MRKRTEIEEALLADERAGIRRSNHAIARATGGSPSWVGSVREEFERGRAARAAERAEQALWSWHDTIGPELRRLPPAWRTALFGLVRVLDGVSDRTPVGPQNERTVEEMLDVLAQGVSAEVRDAIVRAVFAALPVAGEADRSEVQVAGAKSE